MNFLANLIHYFQVLLSTRIILSCLRCNLVTETQLVCQRTERPNKTKTLESGTEKGVLRTPQGDSGSCLKIPKLPKSSQQSSFLVKVRGVCELLANIFGVTVFVFKVRSWSGPFSCKSPSNEILHSEMKGPCPQAQLSPSEVQSWLRGGRSQLAVPSGPGPQTLNCHPCLQGTRCPGPSWPSGSSGCPNGGGEGPGPTDCDPCRWPMP